MWYPAQCVITKRIMRFEMIMVITLLDFIYLVRVPKNIRLKIRKDKTAKLKNVFRRPLKTYSIETQEDRHVVSAPKKKLSKLNRNN